MNVFYFFNFDRQHKDIYRHKTSKVTLIYLDGPRPFAN